MAPIGLIGLAIVACVPSTPEAKKLHAHAKAVKAGLIPQGEHEAIGAPPAVPTAQEMPPDLHEEHNLPDRMIRSANSHRGKG